MISAEDRAAVLEEVRLIVVEALRDGDPVRAEWLAKIVASSYPKSGLSASEVAERIRYAALAAGVAVGEGGVARGASVNAAGSKPRLDNRRSGSPPVETQAA